MCQLILKIYPQQNRNNYTKISIYLLGMSNPIFNFMFQTWQYPFVDMYILKFFLKKHDFATLTFAFKKFQKIRQNLYF